MFLSRASSGKHTKSARVEALATLCDFLPDRSCKRVFRFEVRQLAKDAIESAGIPHTEVDLLLINGLSVPFTQEVHDGDSIVAVPPQHPLTECHVSLVRPAALKNKTFLVDENSGKLASSLLILGFDTSYNPLWADAELARRSAAEQRILLTRDIGLLKRSNVVHGYWLRSHEPRRQIVEVIRRYDLWPEIRPFTRCLDCNARLAGLPVEEARALVSPVTYASFKEFFRCPSCEKAYWKGSHYERMTAWIESLRDELASPTESRESVARD